MIFQDYLLVSNILSVWLFLKNVLSHCSSLLHLHPSLLAKMAVDSMWTLRPAWPGVGNCNIKYTWSSHYHHSPFLQLFFYFAYETVKNTGAFQLFAYTQNGKSN